MLHEAAAVGGHARYPTHFAEPSDVAAKQLQNMDAVTQLLKLDCEVRLRRGDVRATVRSVRTLFALARSFELEPIPSAEYARVEADGAAADCLERLFAMKDLADSDLALLDADLAVIDYLPQFHRALQGQRVLDMRFFDNPRLLLHNAQDVAASAFFREADRAVYLQLMSEAVAASSATDLVSLQAAMKRVYSQVANDGRGKGDGEKGSDKQTRARRQP